MQGGSKYVEGPGFILNRLLREPQAKRSLKAKGDEAGIRQVTEERSRQTNFIGRPVYRL
jgi:hypothetical protein